MKNFSIIVAMDRNNGIAKKGAIPWSLPSDLKFFAKITKAVSAPKFQNAVIMGRKTWEALPEKFKPLPGRINVVLSSNDQLDFPEGVLQFGSLDEALLALSTSPKIEKIFVIGGGQVFEEAILHPNLERIYLTKIEADFDCDVFFPDQIPEEFEIVSATEIMTENDLDYESFVLEPGEKLTLDLDLFE